MAPGHPTRFNGARPESDRQSPGAPPTPHLTAPPEWLQGGPRQLPTMYLNYRHS